MSPPSFSSTVTGKSLNPVAEPWIPKASAKMDHPLFPYQFFHTPPPYAAPTFYYYPGAKLLYNHYCGYFTLSYPQYQNRAPKHDCNVKQQVVVLKKEVGRKAFVPPHRGGGGGYGGDKRKKNVLRPALPPRLLRDDKIFSPNRNNTISVKRKPKRRYSGEKSVDGYVGTKTSVISSSTPRISHDQNDDPLSEKNTTVMIKNIPNKLRRDSLMKFLDGFCKDHRLEYDFIYLPIDFKWLDNLGYAFVNFTTGSAARMIMELLNNYKWGCVDPRGRNKGYQLSKKICEVTWAKIQGKKKLVNHFEESTFACHTFDYLPAEFDPPRNGWTTDTKPKSIGKLKPTGPNYPNHLLVRKSRWAIIP